MVAQLNDEDVSWMKDIPDTWITEVCSHYHPIAREAYAYLSYIMETYDALDDEDEIVFCQGNPTDHCPTFIQDVMSDKKVFGQYWEERCDSAGVTDRHIPMWSYSDVLGLPRKSAYEFSEGAQFRVTGKQITARPINFYRALFCLGEIQGENEISWVLERLWPIIFDIDLKER